MVEAENVRWATHPSQVVHPAGDVQCWEVTDYK